MGYYEISKTAPVAEVVEKLAGPANASITYVPEIQVKIPLTAGVANDFAVAVENPFGIDLIIKRAILDITTAGGTGSSVIDVDVVATVTSTGDDIFDGADANAVATLDSLNSTDNGTNGEGKSWKWNKAGGTLDVITAKILVADAASLAGNLYLTCIPAE